MKKLKLIGVLALIFAFVSCSTEDEISSKVTVYPDLNLIGESVIAINQGDTFTDPGATSFSGENQLDITTSGSVNSQAIGVYKIKYESFNSDGFAASVTRTVIVLSSTPSAINLEGTFFRSGNANNVTRISDRVYVCDNATGYTTTGDEKNDNIKLTFYNLDDTRLYAPLQLNTSVTGLTAESNIGTIINENNWNWVIYASGVFGTAVRNFSR